MHIASQPRAFTLRSAPPHSSAPRDDDGGEENIPVADLKPVLSGSELQQRKQLASHFSGPASYGPELKMLWQHIYHPDRLQEINPDIEVTGTVDRVKSEADGDLHVDIKLDPQYQGLINDKNVGYQHGDLVTEVIYARHVHQTDAKGDSQGFKNPVDTSALVKGAHVGLIGSYVYDRAHGWMEIHPVADVRQA